MNAGSIWWGQVGNALRFLAAVANQLKDGRSAVLQLPTGFPWRQDFYREVDLRRAGFGGERRLVRRNWEAGQEPGQFVLEELCSAQVRADYWPGQSYAEYLGQREDLVLNDYDVWITGIHTRSGRAQWEEFVAQYQRAAKGREHQAVFLLEYDGAAAPEGELEQLRYTVQDCDCRVFCLEAAEALANTQMRTYQAELALCIGEDDPELCWGLLRAGEALLHQPVKTAQAVYDGLGYPEPPDVNRIGSAAWKASVVLFFPILERYRMTFVTRYGEQLSRHLPIHNANGDTVTDPFDLEIGALYFIVSQAKEFPPEEAERIRLCRQARNLLAHIKMLPYEDVERIMALDN